MSLNAKKVTVYSSRPAENLRTHLPNAGGARVADHVNHVPKRTTVRVKISGSEDLEALSAAAKCGLTSWIGGQKVRIVGVGEKHSGPLAAADLPDTVHVSESSWSPTQCVTGFLATSSSPAVQPQVCLAHAVPHNIHTTTVPLTTKSEMCISSASVETSAQQCEDVVACRLVKVASCQSNSLRTVTNNALPIRHCGSVFGSSVMKSWSGCESIVHSSRFQSLPSGIRYLGTFAVNPQTNGSQFVSKDSASYFCPSTSLNVCEKAMISAVKTLSGSGNRSKLSNNRSVDGLTAPLHRSGCVQTECKNSTQECNRSCNSWSVRARCLKRPCMQESSNTDIIPAKKKANNVQFAADSVDVTKHLGVMNSETHRQPLSSDMLNQMLSKFDGSAEHSKTFSQDHVKNSEREMPVSDSCNSQHMFLNEVPRFRLPAATVKFRYKLMNLAGNQYTMPTDVVSSGNSSLPPTDMCKVTPADKTESCARVMPFTSTRKKFNSFTFLLSRHRVFDIQSDDNGYETMKRRMELCDLPMAMRFRHLREFCRETVTIHRSRIHGLGLFCVRDVSTGEMLMEYAGEIIRSSVADVRERRYDAQGIGCYMFRCGDDDVVDATKCGNVARFINHSCEPNCYSRQIIIDGRLHIVIFALHDIRRGVELTYDYKFPIEDVKMPCYCKSRRCRRYLN